MIMEKEKIISRLRGKLDEMHISYGDIDCYDGPTTVTVKVQFDGGDPVGNTLAGVEEEFDTFKDAFGIDKVAFGKDKTRSYADKNHIYISKYLRSARIVITRNSWSRRTHVTGRKRRNCQFSSDTTRSGSR